MASALFSPVTLRGLTLPNRIAVSPMCQYNSDNGSATDWHLMHLGSFSLGAAGLVMTEMTNVHPVGRITARCAGMWSDDNEAAMKRVIDFCRRYGVAKLGLQLAHAGRKGSTQTPAQGGKPLKPEEQGGWKTEAPSAIPYAPDWPVPEALSKHRIKQLIGEWVAAAKRAERIGYDLVEIHGGHGYLSRPFPTSGPTNTAAASRTACAFHSRCAPRCARPGRPTSRWAYAFQRPTGWRAAGRRRKPWCSRAS